MKSPTLALVGALAAAAFAAAAPAAQARPHMVRVCRTSFQHGHHVRVCHMVRR